MKRPRDPVHEKWLESLELSYEQAREKCCEDLWFLLTDVLEYERFYTPLHKPLARSIEMAPRKALVLIPRDHLKTTLITQGRGTQVKLKDFNCRILVSTALFKLTMTILDQIKSHFQNDNHMTWLFPECRLPPAMSKAGGRREEFSLPCRTSTGAKETCYSGAAVDASQVSKHFDYIFLDDLVSDRNIKTSEAIEGVISHYKNVHSLLEPNGQMYIVGTRWDQNDLYGEILPTLEQEGAFIMIRRAMEKNFSTGKKEPIYPRTDRGMERYNEFVLRRLRKDIGNFKYSCNPGHAPVLMADWTERRIDQILPGDVVMGFKFGEGKRRHLTPTVVRDTKWRDAETQTVTLEDGDQIRCTPDHHWYTGRGGERKGNYVRPDYSPAKVGRKMLRVVDRLQSPTDENIRDWGWLAGMIDGEGAVNHGPIVIYQSPVKCPDVCSEIDNVLARLNISYKKKLCEPTDSSFSALPCYRWTLHGGRNLRMRLLTYGKPAKAARIIQSMAMGGIAKEKVIVEEIRAGVEKERVYSMQTDTGNYVVWGYASRNCQYENDPLPDIATRILSPDQVIFCDTVPDGLRNFMFIDPAISTDPSADRTAIVVVGTDYLRNYYVLDVVAANIKPSEGARHIWENWKNYTICAIYCEANALQALYKEYVETLCAEYGGRISFIPSPRKTTQTAIARIMGLQPLFEQGKIIFYRDGRGMDDAIRELTTWSKARAKRGRDDICSALSDAPECCTFPEARRKNTPTNSVIEAHFAEQDRRVTSYDNPMDIVLPKVTL